MKALLLALRPKQWTKNLLLFAGVVFSQHARDPALLLRAVGGFVAFSLLASAVYVVNDLKDVDADRLHPKKRHRPIASGALSPAVAWTVVPLLLVAVAALCSWLGFGFLLVLAAYLASNVAYSFGMKHQVIMDVFLIASGFVLRAVAGVELLKPVAPETQLSAWLLVCTFFGALFLAVSKRRRELMNAGSLAPDQRAVLGTYTPELLDRMLTIAAACTLMSYALYTIWPATVAKFGTEALIVTVPVVAYGVFRYLHLVRVSEMSEDPSLVLLADRPIQLTVLVYVALSLWILYSAR
ncbi:MAG TPA: decaprenyl-phosphate phosphoribosyltransferase [Methylomirabilota bacterium]|nr:decaprenyl-phosphate phosphoribosyltransferase [Methylomirabilota bacterium]